MYNDFSLSYHNGEVLVNGVFMPAGSVACMALNLSKETVSTLEEYYREQRQSGDGRLLRESLSAVDCISVTAELLPDNCSFVLDELICFRVYIRYFLQKYDFRNGCAAAWEAFLDDLDRIAAQLQRLDNLTRTVLYPDFRDAYFFCREKGGVLCETVQLGIGQLLLFDVLRSLQNERPPKRCPCCGRWFVPERANEVYCSSIAPDSGGRTCREVGAGRIFSQKAMENREASLCRRMCGRIYTRKNRGSLSEEEAAELTAKCRELRDRVAAGAMSVEEMELELSSFLP